LSNPAYARIISDLEVQSHEARVFLIRQLSTSVNGKSVLDAPAK
jgi:hypothetical protein